MIDQIYRKQAELILRLLPVIDTEKVFALKGGTREQLIKLVQERLSDGDKQFLLSFKKGRPDWSLLDVKNVEQLPAVQWELLNIIKIDKEKHLTAIHDLEKVLNSN